MATMKAAVMREAGGPEVFRIECRPIPQPGKDRVLIRVMAFVSIARSFLQDEDCRQALNFLWIDSGSPGRSYANNRRSCSFSLGIILPPRFWQADSWSRAFVTSADGNDARTGFS
jgi:hypothetical protein